jgi:hypothetical protein
LLLLLLFDTAATRRPEARGQLDTRSQRELYRRHLEGKRK